MQVDILPQASVAEYNLEMVYWFGQMRLEITSGETDTLTFPQASFTTMREISGRGTSFEQDTVTSGRQTIEGKVVSTFRVNVCEHVAAFPQASTAW